LFLQAGFTKDSIKEVTNTIPQGLNDGENDDEKQVSYFKQRANTHRNKDKFKDPTFKSRNWILEKKEKERNKGKDVRQDTKYTGRRRKLNGI
jgi:hypothetical protein